MVGKGRSIKLMEAALAIQTPIVIAAHVDFVFVLQVTWKVMFKKEIEG